MRKYVIVSLALVATILLGACGGSSSKAASTTTPTTAQLFSSPTYEKAKPTPSTSAQMICQKEARDDIASSLGVTQTSVTQPVWNKSQHIYSCTYVYPKGKITLSVKEMSSADETTAYFDSIQSQFGKTQQLIGLGQGAWILKNNDVVVRKDYKVLLVNVQGIPATFAPLMSRSDVATNIAVAIMGCWSGT